MSLTLDNETAQIAFGEALGRALNGRGQLHLLGELGAGKTTLSRGILRAYGYQGAVKSPTYTLVEPYELDDLQIYHFDLYRLGDPEELEFMGARDMFSENSLCLVEWPSRGAGFLPRADIEIHLAVADHGRRVWAVANSDYGTSVLAQLPDELSDKEAEC